MWTLSNNKDWQSLEEQFDWVRDMKQVPQDPRHHAEGNVAIHTQMVLAELTKTESFQTLTAHEQELLWAAALLHDVEKRSTTVTEPDGSVTAHGHSRRGASTARQLLYRELPTSFAIREQIVGLVRHHGLPLWLLEKPDPARTLIKASLEIDTRLLAMLARADAQGRICQDKEDLLYRIDCFEEFCKEHQSWGQPRPFASSQARMHYLQKENTSPDYIPFDPPETRAILMSGLPGAGKDHYIRKHYPDLPVISLDAIRIEMKVSHKDTTGNGQVIQAAKEKAREFLRAHQPFVWNGTNITRQLRAQLIDLFTQYRAAVTIVYIEVPYRTLMQQNRNRTAIVPTAAMEKLIDKLEPPAPWEAHELTLF